MGLGRTFPWCDPPRDLLSRKGIVPPTFGGNFRMVLRTRVGTSKAAYWCLEIEDESCTDLCSVEDFRK